MKKSLLYIIVIFYYYNVTGAQFLYPTEQRPATQQNPAQINLLTIERETAAREAAAAALNSKNSKSEYHHHQQQQPNYQNQHQQQQQQSTARYSFFYANAERDGAEGNNSVPSNGNFQIYFVPFNNIDAPIAAATTSVQGMRKFDATNQAEARQFYVNHQQQQQQQQTLYQPQLYQVQQQQYQQQYSQSKQDPQQQQQQYEQLQQQHQQYHQQQYLQPAQQQDPQQQQQNLQNTAPHAFPSATLAIPQNSQSFTTFYQHPAMQQMFYPQPQYPAGTMPLRPYGSMPQYVSYGPSAQPQHPVEQFQAPFRASPFMGYSYEHSTFGPVTSRAQMQNNFYPTTGQYYHRYVKPIYENPREGHPSGDQTAAASTMKNGQKLFYLSPQNMYALFKSRRT